MSNESEDRLRAVAAEHGLHSAVGRFCIAAAGVVGGSGNANLRALLRACGSEMQLSSPRGIWFQRLAASVDLGDAPGAKVRLPDAQRGDGQTKSWDQLINIKAS